MPRIYVQFPELTRLGEQCTSISKQLDTLQSDVQHTVQRLDWDVKFQDDIYSTGRQIARRLGGYVQALDGYNAFLKDAHDRYIQLDQEAERDRSNIWGLPFWSPGHVPPIVQPPVPCPFLFTLPKWLKPADPVEDIKSFLDALNALLDQDAFGILKDITSYFQDLFAFLTGDKKGMTGACDWLDLTDSSFQLWDGFYDYFRKLYEGKGDFFSDIAQKRVKSIGIATGLLGLLSSVLSASQGLDEKQWTSIVADYVNSGKDVIPVVDAIYSLRHIGDTNSLAEVKDGPWSALDVYGAVGEAGISAISMLLPLLLDLASAAEDQPVTDEELTAQHTEQDDTGEHIGHGFRDGVVGDGVDGAGTFLQDGQEEGDEHHTEGVELCQPGHGNAGEAHAAGHGVGQGVLDAGDQDEAHDAGDGAGDGHGADDDLGHVDAGVMRGGFALAHHGDLKAVLGVFQVAEHEEHQQDDEEDADGDIPHVGHSRAALEQADELGAPGALFPGAALEVLDDADGDVVHHQGKQRFVGAPLGAEHRRDETPQRAADGASHAHDQDEQPGGPGLCEVQGEEGGKDAAHGDLTFYADVPELHLKGGRNGQGCAQQGDGNLDGLLDGQLAAQTAVDHGTIDGEGTVAQSHEDECA